jgi:glucose-6-phosphate isomerase
MVFGALCDRQYGFVYDGVRARGGLAWFPICDGNTIRWQQNFAYDAQELATGSPRPYVDFGLHEHVPLYRQFEQHADALQWVSDPARVSKLWDGFTPLGAVQARYSRT